MSKLITHFNGTVRAAPFFINFMSILIGFFFRQPVGIFFGLYSYVTDIGNHFLKLFFKNIIYSNNDPLPLLGYGKRPKGAKYCGIFIDEYNIKGLSTSFGMPSGHSHFATMTGVFWIMYMLQNYPKNLYNNIIISIIAVMSITIMISRYYLGCHTIQQILFGGLIGLFTGYYGYKLYIFISKYIKNY